MRIVKPKDFERLQQTKRSTKFIKISSLVVRGVLVLMVVLGAVFWLKSRPDPVQPQPNNSKESVTSTDDSAETQTKKKLKTFTGVEFMALAVGVKYPNTQAFDVLPSITGNAEADERIRQLAEKRGYRLTSIPVSPIERLHEPRLAGDDLLQPLAAKGWRDLKAAAERDGKPLSIISAYRSPEYQRTLFGDRLSAAGATTWAVAQGQADALVNVVLGKTAVPGFSRHHTGYTIDLWCEDGSTAFVLSSCFDWISKDNYKVAKEAGWIPSYPEDAKLQGPEPEPWEYVWVGADVLYE